jgi:hypothetical protein
MPSRREMSGTRKVGLVLMGVSVLGVAVAAAGVPLIPTTPCLPPATPLPKLALISLGGLTLAALAGMSGLGVLLSELERGFRRALMLVIGLALPVGAAWAGVAILALERTKDWSCAGG